MTSPKSIISWNVNGIRSAIKKGFKEFLDQESPDIICLQETKISNDLVKDFIFKDYPHLFWNCAEKKGYSGTAIISKYPPIKVTNGIAISKHDKEGRVITAEYADFYLVTVYTPNSQDHDENGKPKRLNYRTLEWDVDFLNYLIKLEQSKPVIFCGDLNVAHQEIDLANPATNTKNAGFTNEERERFNEIIKAGFIDTFRYIYPNKKDIYTWWSYRARARERNIGWRIDYFCVSSNLKDNIDDVNILDYVLGSDHCPVSLNLK